VAGTVALAGALPRFFRYDGRNGMALKKAADDAWRSAAAPAPTAPQ
jgi:hypothetical protein